MDNLGMTGNPFLGTNNPYLQKQIDGTMGDMATSYNMLAKPNQETSMVNSGSFGNSGLQQIQGQQLSDQQKAMGQVSNNMRMQDYGNQQQMYQWDQGFNKSIYDTTFNQNQQNLQNVTGLLGQMNNFGQQDIANSTNIQNTPMNYFNSFSGAANQIGSGGGSSNQSMPGNPTAGFLGGAMLGNQFGQSMGWGAPQGSATKAALYGNAGYG